MTEQVDLLEQAKQHWPQIVSSLVGEPNKSMSNKDDIRYGTKGSLSIHPSKFVYKNYETGEGGGIIDFIKQENHFDTNYQVMTWLNEFLGSDHANTPPPQFENRNPNNTYTQDSAQGTQSGFVRRIYYYRIRQSTPTQGRYTVGFRP